MSCWYSQLQPIRLVGTFPFCVLQGMYTLLKKNTADYDGLWFMLREQTQILEGLTKPCAMPKPMTIVVSLSSKDLSVFQQMQN